MRYQVHDTITLERTWTVEAENEDEAVDLVERGDVVPESEEQIDQTPYQAEAIETETDEEDNETDHRGSLRSGVHAERNDHGTETPSVETKA